MLRNSFGANCASRKGSRFQSCSKLSSLDPRSAIMLFFPLICVASTKNGSSWAFSSASSIFCAHSLISLDVPVRLLIIARQVLLSVLMRILPRSCPAAARSSMAFAAVQHSFVLLSWSRISSGQVPDTTWFCPLVLTYDQWRVFAASVSITVIDSGYFSNMLLTSLKSGDLELQMLLPSAQSKIGRRRVPCNALTSLFSHQIRPSIPLSETSTL